MHPLVQVAITKPHLLAVHAEGYADLALAEAATVAKRWRQRIALHAAALCGWVVAAVLAGMALMLWAVIPDGHAQTIWPLIVVPLVPLAFAVVCQVAARAPNDEQPFADVRRQLAADLVMLREAGRS